VTKSRENFVYQEPDEQVIQSLSIDNVIFGIGDGVLKVLLVRQEDPRHAGSWALPGGWLRRAEDLRDAAYRILKELTGLSDFYLQQLKTFGKVERFPGERVVTVAYYALVNAEAYTLVLGNSARDAAWHDVNHVPDLVYDHNEILSVAIERLRRDARDEPIGFELLPARFTLAELQSVYEAIFDAKLDKSNFRRRIIKLGFLEECMEKQHAVPHRAARYYQVDKKAYHALKRRGFGAISFV